MGDIKFSVIVPTYNRGHLIEKTIESVLIQTHSNFEVIIVDDGSSDNTEEVIFSINDPRLKYFKRENSERGSSRNFGISVAQGHYVTFIDSDDIFYENHLNIAYNYINNKNHAIFWHGFDLITPNGVVIKRHVPIRNSVKHHLINYGNALACIGVFIPLEVAKKFLFIEDRKMAGSEDMELWLRLSAYHKINAINRATCAMVQHPDRSVLNVNMADLILRKELMLKYLFQDKKASLVYAEHKARLQSATFSYISLHASMGPIKNKTIAIKYALKSILRNPSCLFTRRILVIIKNILLKY